MMTKSGGTSKCTPFINEFLSTCCYTGYSPFAPGTVGSMVVIVLGALLGWILGTQAAAIILLISVLPATLAGVPLGTWAEHYYGRKDPSPFVLDEFAGCAIALGLPLLLFPQAPFWVVAALAFFTFRFFDIFKLFPANRMERLPGGWGIMLDDLVAGAYAAIVSCVVIATLYR